MWFVKRKLKKGSGTFQKRLLSSNIQNIWGKESWSVARAISFSHHDVNVTINMLTLMSFVQRFCGLNTSTITLGFKMSVCVSLSVDVFQPYLRRMLTRKWLTKDEDFKQLHSRTERLRHDCSVMKSPHTQVRRRDGGCGGRWGGGWGGSRRLGKLHHFIRTVCCIYQPDIQYQENPKINELSPAGSQQESEVERIFLALVLSWFGPSHSSHTRLKRSS